MKDSCLRFRDRFEPGLQAPHRDRCADCSRFAEILEGSAAPEIHRPMTSRLRQRLRAIPHQEVTCRDDVRLYRATLRRAMPDRCESDPPAQGHLEACARCRDLYGTLYCAMVPEHRSMPGRLARRIGSIARHPERLLPLWIRDTRYAAAACYLLASLTLTLAEDASALFRETTASVSSQAVVWTDAGEARGTEAWDTISSTLQRGVTDGWNQIQHLGERGERWLLDTFRAIEDSTHQLIPDRERSVEGENNG